MSQGIAEPARDRAGNTPLVSCIMPTRNRRRFVSQATAYFLRQDYPNRELVIVDDGEDPVDDLLPADGRIHYHRPQVRPASLGARRNLAVELSRGDLIAHWDDDDWISPERLSRQVAAIEASAADVCGARVLLHYRPEADDAWLYDYGHGGAYSGHGRPYLGHTGPYLGHGRSYPGHGWTNSGQPETPQLAGCTLLYRRSLWANRPFPPLQIGEDIAFLAGLRPVQVSSVDLYSHYVALLHSGNTAPRNLSDPHWQRRPLDDVARLLAGDLTFYMGSRAVNASVGGGTSSFGSVTLVTHLLVYEGYGTMAEYLALGMANAGARVDVIPLALDPSGLTEEVLELCRRSRPEPSASVLCFSWPRPELGRFRSTPDLFYSTMWESSRLPRGWADELNHARAVISPTRFVARIFRDSGVTVPVEVVPLGVDPSVYHYETRREREGLTALIVAPITERKHTHEAIAAWKLAFEGDQTARLIVKARYQYGNWLSDDPRIQVVDGNEGSRGIAHWYREADLLLALGSEGFGLPLIEGMATGLPVIALSSEGQGDVCEEAPDLLLPVAPASWHRADDELFGPAGVRGAPGVEAVVARLRWVAEHRHEAAAMGRAASEWALRHRNVWMTGPATLDAMECHLRPPRRPLRRAWRLWAPSLGTPCGVAEYSRHLAEHLPSARIGTEPELEGTRLLHVQYEPSLGMDGRLAESLARARSMGVSVAVTQHLVAPAAPSWESEPDALIATTRRGAAMLEERQPGKRIHHIPHGCPTWFPRRKAHRERVIGAFGFLEWHKGFWQLLDMVDQVADAELVIYSYAKRPEIASAWEAAVEGRRVRHIAEFLPIHEVARHLAAEADILVFWYEETSTAQASLAVRVGLATGVPVLTSPTSWFEDLGDAVFQPADLIAGSRQLLEDDDLRQHVVAAARDHCDRESWPRIAERHRELWRWLEGA